MECHDLKQLSGELTRLLDKQLQTLEDDMFLGLDESELQAYDERQERIRELTARLDTLGQGSEDASSSRAA